LAEKNDGTVTVEVEKRLEDLFREDGESFDFLEENDDSEDAPPVELEVSPDFLEDNSALEHSPPRELEDTSGFEEDGSGLDQSPLKELKTIVLSIDWEINDEDMTRFVEQVETLKLVYENDRVVLLFLQMLGSLGKYIRTNKGNSHPNAIKVLNSAYTSLEKVLLQKDVTDAEKEKILLVEVQRFKELEEQVALKRAAAHSKKDTKTPQEAEANSKGKEKDMAPIEESGTLGSAEEGLSRPDMNRMAPHEAFAYALEEIKQMIKAEFKSLRAELKLWREGQ
jgi:hypothetical protein